MASILKFKVGPRSVPREDDAEKEQVDPLTPELKEFIEKVIVPCLVRRYLRKLGSEKTVAESTGVTPSFSLMDYREPQANQ